MACHQNIKFFVDADNMVTLCNPNGEKGISFSLIPAVWWFTLTAFSLYYLYQVYLMLIKTNNKMDRKISPMELRYCAAIYIVACAVRSIWPRIDVERVCFFESWISYPIVGRSLATVAEICFAHQIAYVLSSVASQLKCNKIKSELKLVVPIIVVAQTCCWLGVTTQRQVWHGIEESIWLVVMQVCGIFALYMSTLINVTARIKDSTMYVWGSDASSTKQYLQLSFLLSVCFSAFMFFVDVPMYLNRYFKDEENHKQYLTITEGIYDASSCKLVSTHLNEWGPEIPWLSGYFIGATYMSLKLTTLPRVTKEFEEEEKKS